MSAMRSLLATQDAASSIIATVGGWFRSRGIGTPYRCAGDTLDCGVDRKTPDDERWLDWARRCVRPRAEQLAKRYGWRFVAESLVGRIRTFEEWESLVNSLEVEFVGDE